VGGEGATTRAQQAWAGGASGSPLLLGYKVPLLPTCLPPSFRRLTDSVARPTQAAHTLLARALAWQRVNAVVRGGDALRFVAVAGSPNSGPAEAAAFGRLTQGQQPLGAARGGAVPGGKGATPAVDIRPLADPGLRGAQARARESEAAWLGGVSGPRAKPSKMT
jgi:hypothetical protein